MKRRESSSNFLVARWWGMALAAAFAWQDEDEVRRVGMLLRRQLRTIPNINTHLRQSICAGIAAIGCLGHEGRNIRIDIRWAGGGAETNRRCAEELVALAPDVIVAAGNASAGANAAGHTDRTSRFYNHVPDAVGLPDSLTVSHDPAATLPASRVLDMTLAGNGWSCSREITRPRVTRVAVSFTRFRSHSRCWPVECHSNREAPSFGMEAIPINPEKGDARELEAERSQGLRTRRMED